MQFNSARKGASMMSCLFLSTGLSTYQSEFLRATAHLIHLSFFLSLLKEEEKKCSFCKQQRCIYELFTYLTSLSRPIFKLDFTNHLLVVT